MSLKPTPPHEAKNRFLNDKKPGVTRKTLKNYRTSLRQFCDWLDDQQLTNLNDLDSELVQQYKEFRLSKVKHRPERVLNRQIRIMQPSLDGTSGRRSTTPTRYGLTTAIHADTATTTETKT